MENPSPQGELPEDGRLAKRDGGERDEGDNGDEGDDGDEGDEGRIGKRRITEPGPGSLVDGATEETAALSSQEQVGRYVIQHFLAEGGMGVVYAAFDPELGRHVAVKLVKKRGGAEGHLRERLLREAQALAQLSHPNVVAIHDVGIHDDRVFLAMELVEGVSLRGWLEQPRPWRETLQVLLAAGRGLAAAHSAGIVHRDFKPDNVIVGNDGRVCVLDFGLARAVDGVATEPGASAVPAESDNPDDIATAILGAPPAVGTVDGRERLEKNLTRLGTVIGTPAYMSPEHHRGEPVTSLSDQYSYCVAAWEALYKQRPFSSQGDLLAEKERQRIAEPPRKTKVPAQLRRLLVRGLSPEPGARHASVAALLAELEKVLRAPRRWARIGAVAGAAVAVGAVAAAVAWRSAAGPALCSTKTARARLAETWNGALAARLEGAFAATKRPHAAATAARARGELGRYGDEWAAMHAESCAATHVRHEQSAAMLDLRTRCLEQRRDSLRALVAQLVKAPDGAVVDRAVAAIQGLPPVRDCAQLEALGAATPLPEAPERRTAIAAARSTLGDARALLATGQYAKALPVAREVVKGARALGYAPLLAEALHTQTALEDQLNHLDEAAASAQESVVVAGTSRDDALLVHALVDLMWSLSHRAKNEEALALAAPVEAMIARAEAASGGRPALSLRADLTAAVGWFLSEQGKFAESVTRLEEAMRLREQEAPQSWQVAVSLNNLGESLRALGRNEEARQRFEQALAITARTLGADHPNAGAIYNNLATVLESESRYEEARAMYLRSLEIDEATFGPEHSRVAVSLLNLGSLDDSLGKPEASIEAYERALRIQRKTHGDKHPDVAMVLHNLGQAEMSLGKIEEGMARSKEALAIFEETLPADHAYLGPPLTGIGEALTRLGRAREALPYYERALAVQRKALGEDVMEVAPTLHGLGAVLLATGRAAEAVAWCEKEVAIYAKDHGEVRAWADAELQLAKALWSGGGDKRRAVAVAMAARERLAQEKAGNAAAGEAVSRQLDEWLRAHHAR